MWNLIKNTFRSFNKNKVSLIGLSFLTFLSIGLFTNLQSTSSAIKNEYNSITQSGNLHDFTVAENYNIGNIVWTYDPIGWSNDRTPSTDQPDIPWPTQIDNGDSTWTRTYTMELDTSTIPPNTLAYQFFQNHQADPDYQQYLFPTIHIQNSPEKLDYLDEEHVPGDKWTQKNYDQVMTEIKDSGDPALLNSKEGVATQELIKVITQNDTPIQHYLSDSLQDQVSYRKFQSLNVSNSPDDIFYKIVKSNADDEIDKVHIFGDGLSRNFNTSDFNPLQNITWDVGNYHWNFYNDLFVIPQGQEGKPFFSSISDLIHSQLQWDSTKTYSNLTDIEKEKVHAYFIVLNNSIDDVDSASTLKPIIQDLSNKNASNWEAQYNNFRTWDKPDIVDHGYKISLSFPGGTPGGTNWAIQDWTANFAIVNPEYLTRHNIQPYVINDVDSFKAQMNTWSDQQRKTWLLNNVSNQNSISLGGEGGIKFVVIASGVTPDFMYPIMDIEHSTPNPNKECILFGNTNAYNRVEDSYRSNPTENYLVGKFINGADPQQTLDNINQKCKEVMTWPQGMRAAYMKDDVTDFLNASAFRVAYIPKLVNSIEIISFFLTIFILILGLFICAMVINRYVTNSRTQIGIMQANGIKKFQIAFSLIPFAIIPAIVGGVGGYIVGTLLQSATAGFFSNYWMLPTPFLTFHTIFFIVAILVPFLLFMIISICVTFALLRENTVNLMKQGSEIKTNILSRNIKKPFDNLNVIAKFRLSLAFNSIWKLVVLIVMTSLAMSSLVFGITATGKFDSAKDQTFSSRNYTYAVDLTSPTSQGGQYIPINLSGYGESGFIESSEGKNWVPNNYFDEVFENNGDESFKTIFGPSSDDERYGIPKVYHAETYVLYNTMHSSGGGDHGGIEKSLISDDQQHVYGSTFFPMLSSMTGLKNDLLYTKNTAMIKSGLNFNVGVPGFQSSNPWMLAVALMPENQQNLCDTRTKQIVQQLGEAVCWTSSDNPYTASDVPLHADTNFFNVEDTRVTGNSKNDPKCDFNYSFNSDKCVDIGTDPTGVGVGQSLRPNFMKFITEAYRTFHIKEVSGTDDKLMNDDYTVSYNKVPLNDGDETYTYLSVTGNKQYKTYKSNLLPPANTRIVGVKSDTKYVNLVDGNNKNLLPLLNYKLGDDYPIIVNAYAAHKYGLKIGDKMSFTIDNKANLVQKTIRDEHYSPEKDSDAIATFKVVGINTTYQGEEYFTNQQLANMLLGLKSTYDASPYFSEQTNHNQIHNYYYSSMQITNMTGDGALSPPGSDDNFRKEKDFVYDLNSDLQDPDTFGGDDTISLWNPAKSYIDDSTKVQNNGQITPFGFNGVFTKRSNGSAILFNNGGYLYSRSGLYVGNDSFQSSVFQSLLSIGPNLEVASIITGFYVPGHPSESTTIGQQIHEAYNTWINSTDNTTLKTNHDALVALATPFITELTKIYGDVSYTTLTAGAIDKDSTEMIFDNLSITITSIEDATIAIISLMVTLIVMLITIMIVNDAKRLAAILKALGYTDKENVASYLSIYVPILFFGLLFSLPLSFGLTLGFQAIIFSSASILINMSIQWWSYLIALASICAVFSVSGIGGYVSLRREKLIEQIKG